MKAHMDCSFIMFPLPAKSAYEVSAPASSQPHLSWLQQEPFPIWCADTTFYGALCHCNDLCQNNHSSKGKVFEHGPFTSLQYKKKTAELVQMKNSKRHNRARYKMPLMQSAFSGSRSNEANIVELVWKWSNLKIKWD